MVELYFFFFQAEDGIRDLRMSRGLGDVYKRQDVRMAILVPFKWSSEDSGGNPNLMISHSRDFPFSERGHSKLSPESPVEFSE